VTDERSESSELDKKARAYRDTLRGEKHGVDEDYDDEESRDVYRREKDASLC
jgi:hypothetical protein